MSRRTNPTTRLCTRAAVCAAVRLCDAIAMQGFAGNRAPTGPAEEVGRQP